MSNTPRYLIILIFLIYIFRNYIFEKDFEPDPHLKYILLWTTEENAPFSFIGLGQQGFIRRNCSYTNCFVVTARRFFGDHRKFHAILFAHSGWTYLPEIKLPSKRSPEQKFVFSGTESSHYYPVCSDMFDGYFNWTWSFRLDSDCRWKYMAVRDEQNRVIGPNKNMHWMQLKDMRPVSDAFKKSLQSKTKAAVWFASNCKTKNRREVYVKRLQKALQKLNHTIDIIGKCGNMSCHRGLEICQEKIRKDYYFYLAFENSFSEDYVTEKLMSAILHNAIPIVYGGANYTRFMPDGIYLNARKFSPKKLAKKMNDLIHNPEKYAEYFKWQNHYSYHYPYESADTDEFCAFCELLNDKVKFKQESVIYNFREWWNSPDYCAQSNCAK